MKTTAYLVLEPEWESRWVVPTGSEPGLEAIKVTKVLQRFPQRRDQRAGAVVVKVTLNVADEAFLPLRPEVEIDIPAEHTEAIVVVSDPVDVPG